MYPIFIFGEKSEMADDLLKIFRIYGSIHISKNSVESAGTAPYKFIFIDADNFTDIKCNEGILIFKNNLKSIPNVKLSSSFFAVVRSDNEKALMALKNSGVSVITCGMSVRDTLSISSISDDSASVSLQRELILPENTIVYPQEIAIKFLHCSDSYTLLAAAAVKLILNDSFDNFCI